MSDSQVFIRNLSAEEKNDILNFILNKFELEDKDNARIFYDVMVSYIKTVRRDIKTFKNNVDEVLDVFLKCGYNNNQIIQILTREPSLLHSDKHDIFWRVLLLGKVYDTHTNMSVRKSYLIQNPRILRTSQDVLYARIKYLESDEGKLYLRKESNPTARQVTKLTHNEFETSYHISKEDLVNKYPFDNKAQLDVVSWPENIELLDNIYKGKTR